MNTSAKAPVPSAPPPAAAPVSLTETPEFQAAVAEKVKELLPEVIKQLQSTVEKPEADAATTNLFRSLALSIAEISDQGTSRKRVAPEILAQREAAWKRMVALIQEARATGQKPEYKAISKLYLNERMIEPFQQDPATKMAVPVTFTWTGEPNDGMRPLNEIARKIYAEFRASRGSAETSSKEDARPYWMTPAGLVVKGDPPPRREIATPDRVNFVDDLSVGDEPPPADPHDINAPFIHVLGTVAAPAMQNYQGKQV